MKPKKTSPNSFELETLEPRLLLSGDGLLGAAAADSLNDSNEPLDAIWVQEDTPFEAAEGAVEDAEKTLFDLEDEALVEGSDSAEEEANDDVSTGSVELFIEGDIDPDSSSLDDTASRGKQTHFLKN